MTSESSMTEMRSGFLSDRILHVHPTRLCNLSCLHCYSESGPSQKTSLEWKTLQQVLPFIRSEGYELVSLSGGEPLMYRDIAPLIDYAHEIGFRVTMITNGISFPQRLDEIALRLDGIAISFDGLGPTHNRIRGRADAFERSCATVMRLAKAGLSVAAAISLTRDAIPDLPDLVGHLVDLGAKVLQIRPVAVAGRARTMEGLLEFSATDRARLYLVVLALQEEFGDTVRLHCDLAPVTKLWEQRSAYQSLLANCYTEGAKSLPLASLINPLIITDIGTLKPIAFDFDRHFDIASIESVNQVQLEGYKNTRLSDFKFLIGNALADLQDSGGLIDWFDHCTRLSEKRKPERFAVDDQSMICALNASSV